ncbi:MAG: transporter substrate-binding domain-containing protein, partial [Phycisphaerales bacterium]|nr:transporter substrate-binding domain-containing protein [Phycisphaerales bacterium]
MLTSIQKCLLAICLVTSCCTLLAEASAAQASQAEQGVRLSAQETDAIQRAAKDPIVVGVTHAPPFSYKESGGWDGLSLKLWEKIAEDLGVKYTIKEFTLEGLIDSL